MIKYLGIAWSSRKMTSSSFPVALFTSRLWQLSDSGGAVPAAQPWPVCLSTTPARTEATKMALPAFSFAKSAEAGGRAFRGTPYPLAVWDMDVK